MSGIARFPTDRVTLVDASPEDLVRASEYTTAPLVMLAVDQCAAASDVIDQVTDGLLETLRQTVDLWLPEVASRDGTLLTTKAARRVARDRAKRLAQNAAIQQDLAEFAVSGRCDGLARHAVAPLLAQISITLEMVLGSRPIIGMHGIATSGAWIPAARVLLEWFGVWLIDVDIPATDGDGCVRVSLKPQPRLSSPLIPALSGAPHPRSTAEATLERALAAQPWAASRHWNYLIESGALMQASRVDLLFSDAGLVVEIDGPDHLRPIKYAADRRRDLQLLLAGYRIARFTNEQVLGDSAWVTDVIKALMVGA